MSLGRDIRLFVLAALLAPPADAIVFLTTTALSRGGLAGLDGDTLSAAVLPFAYLLAFNLGAAGALASLLCVAVADSFVRS